MTQKSPVTVWILSIVTFGIYGLLWLRACKHEMNAKYNAGIPTTFLLIVPIANLFYMWKWAGGAEKANGGKYSQVISFLLFLVPFAFGIFLHQSAFNEASARGGGMAMQR